MKRQPVITLKHQDISNCTRNYFTFRHRLISILLGITITFGITLGILTSPMSYVFQDFSGNSKGSILTGDSTQVGSRERIFPTIFEQNIYPLNDAPMPSKTLISMNNLVEYDSSNPQGLCYRNYSITNDIIPDFSRVGYESGDQEIPENILTMVTVIPAVHPSDDTERIQLAIDRLEQLPVDSHTGYRGALLLKSGLFKVSKTLRITQSGVVIRGDPHGNTTILATGKNRFTVFQVTGKGRPMPKSRITAEILQTYVPVGSVQLRINPMISHRFRVGDEIIVERRGNQNWIQEIGMHNLSLYRPQRASSVVNWRPFKLLFTRTVQAIDRTSGIVTLDIPITNSIEKRWGGGRIFPYRFYGRLNHVGIEHINLISEYDASKVSFDEMGEKYFSDGQHSESVLSFERMIHGFARNITARHFNNFISVSNHAKWVTVENCQYLEPVAPLEGGNRYAFFIDRGAELILFKGNYAEHARHAFIVGSQVTGPNVFHNCTAENQHGSSEPHHRWSVGGLFDNVHSSLSIQNRKHLGSGHGWSGANYVLWNTVGRAIAQKPPTAWNFAFGVIGEQNRGVFGKDIPQGWWHSLGAHVNPTSLYKAQLQQRKKSIPSRWCHD
ncbi:hypothetical protein K7432_008971 [Basidiobolus ranarum]|uniref:Uncharacterized protein n=1 Tax=Basidiobolus ranarum TaxID=34480 RepID=A0ABR2VXS5_9FUNG